MRLISRLLRGALAPPPPTAGPGTVSTVDPSERIEALLREGNEQFRNGRSQAAKSAFEAVLELDGRHARAHYMLSGLAFQRGDLITAIALARKAVAFDPENAEFRFSLGSLYCANQHHELAVPEFQDALRLRPGMAQWHVELAAALTRSGRVVDAEREYETAARLVPDAANAVRARARCDLGDARLAAGDARAAEQAYREAAMLAPDSPAIVLGLGACLRDQQRPVDAETHARRAVGLAPDLADGWALLGSVLSAQGRHVDAVAVYRKALDLVPGFDAAWSGMLLSMNYAPDFTAQEVFEAHLRWAQRFANLVRQPPARAAASTGRRIRLGYISGDLCQHPVAFFLEPILRHHDRSRFEVFCYHTGRKQDAVTARLKAQSEHWRAVSHLPDPDLERTLREDALDILVDLSGHTEGERLAVLAQRVAPVQATYLGYPNTTGLPAMDYRITDARADPPGEADRLHVEKLVRLPETFLCYAPPREAPEPIRSAPYKSNGRPTFGCFNNFAKISQGCIELWSRILAALPDSKLLIKTQGLQDEGLRALLLQRLEAVGVGRERVEILPPLAEHRQHMAAYNRVDVALDTFPYNGTTTTMDALWMGVPVVTLAGDRHASRVGASILSALGLDRLVARTPDQYVATATELARDAGALSSLGGSLRARLAASVLTDGARFTAQLEEAYRDIHTGAR
jgi:predicted O-linked N-acetylglucosamine transferase (SPINDLY family)